MSALTAVTCSACGGAVAMELGRETPRCLFCGSEAVLRQAVPESVEPPQTYLPFAIDKTAADAAFRKFARSSFWYPSDIRQARLELRELLLPAWVWSGTVESHYAALVSAGTRSGKSPVAGSRTDKLEGVLIPASSALTRAELAAISPFEMTSETAFDAGNAPAPFELGQLTRSAATAEATRALQDRHRGMISAQLGAQRISSACLYAGLDGRPVLLPIWIGAYRRGKDSYRIVINGLNGRLTGTAPLSWLKIGCAILSALGCLGLLLLIVALAGAIGSR